MQYLTLDTVCDVLNGYAFKSKKYVSTGIRIIRINNVQDGYIEDKTPVFYPKEDEHVSKYRLLADDVLVSLTGNVGRVAIINDEYLPAALNQRVACLRVKNSKVLKKYLFYFLNSKKFRSDCISSANGIAQKNISTKWLKKYKISIPSIEEQRKKVAILSKLESAIKKKNEQINKINLLAKARFVEMFAQEQHVSKMSQACFIITDGTHQSPEFVTKGIPFVFVSNLINNQLIYDTQKFIDENTYNKLIKRTPIEKGDLLLSIVGSYGHVAVVKSNKKFLFQRHIAYIKVNPNLVDSEYLQSELLDSYVQNQIRMEVHGVAQKTLNLSAVKNLTIKLPPLASQKKFAFFKRHVDKSKVVNASIMKYIISIRFYQYFDKNEGGAR
ncbi:restriction endonuclease subunit S [Lactobacillus ultunensis]|uniref:Type I restriction modification DNA specificity domain protein n=1 Tax=Lactobacillus ultunensis DSM 16047 TaxID=525365 RepID=C2EKP9_9LACO|nr:restriction endonuclease subunit S [Lactobacillus ultunensis]EEJ72920.1 type I restriction modification DNA specificity domain protein [Lactobacillus ultunensis DSM 16047]KRL81718.1 restriction modification system DNA specificity subunit [Lactobacillus ultunensis DSM 16047]QQP29218.1 restriction endonuclease subunit S [Lactobacillus ultunensis]